jgi:hypothetical protein
MDVLAMLVAVALDTYIAVHYVRRIVAEEHRLQAKVLEAHALQLSAYRRAANGRAPAPGSSPGAIAQPRQTQTTT